jgi:hypothetical protein
LFQVKYDVNLASLKMLNIKKDTPIRKKPIIFVLIVAILLMILLDIIVHLAELVVMKLVSKDIRNTKRMENVLTVEARKIMEHFAKIVEINLGATVINMSKCLQYFRAKFVIISNAVFAVRFLMS